MQLSNLSRADIRKSDYILLQSKQLRKVEIGKKVDPENGTESNNLMTIIEAMGTFSEDQESGLFEIISD